MMSQPERFMSRSFLLVLLAAFFLFTMNCIIGDLFMMQYNQDRTATSFARDTQWIMTYTEEARRYNDKTATSYQQTVDSRDATYRVEILTEDAQMTNIAETAKAPKIPVITGINFPKEIPGNKSTIIGLLYFTDPDGDIKYITYDVIRAENFHGGADNAPKLDSGDRTNGAFKIYLWCEGQQVVTLQATLYDWAGNRSNSMSFTFTCK